MKTIAWLTKRHYPPYIYLFRNLERGQVLYSQIPKASSRDIDLQWTKPNQMNKKPVYGQRRDLWKLMCCVMCPSHEYSEQLYIDLISLRNMRDQIKDRTQGRLVNEFGQVWYSGQYRPIYAQEAVADLKEGLLKNRLNESGDPRSTIYWEDIWRMGSFDKNWKDQLPNVLHKQLPRVGNMAREESAILKELRREDADSKVSNTEL